MFPLTIDCSLRFRFDPSLPSVLMLGLLHCAVCASSLTTLYPPMNVVAAQVFESGGRVDHTARGFKNALDLQTDRKEAIPERKATERRWRSRTTSGTLPRSRPHLLHKGADSRQRGWQRLFAPCPARCCASAIALCPPAIHLGSLRMGASALVSSGLYNREPGTPMP